jgi:hypothetical protein
MSALLQIQPREPSEPAERRRAWHVSEPWVEFMIRAARAHNHRDAATPFVDAVYLKPGYQCLRVRGNVPPHTDRAFPEWVYLLAFRADDAVMHCHGLPPMRLQPGMLFEFNEHRRHRVEQDPDSMMIWTPLDSDRRLSFEEAMEGHRRQFSEGSTATLKGSVQSEITTDRHRIVHDGRIVRAYDARNFCVAFLDRGGFCVAYQEANGANGAGVQVKYPLLTMRRPRLTDWARMKALLEHHHGLSLPDTAMPKWLPDNSEAHR